MNISQRENYRYTFASSIAPIVRFQCSTIYKHHHSIGRKDYGILSKSSDQQDAPGIVRWCVFDNAGKVMTGDVGGVLAGGKLINKPADFYGNNAELHRYMR